MATLSYQNYLNGLYPDDPSQGYPSAGEPSAEGASPSVGTGTEPSAPNEVAPTPFQPTPTNPNKNALAAAGAGSLVGIGAGLYQTFWANNQLKNLNNQPAPNYSISPELQGAYNESLSNKNIGLTPGEKASFQSDTNRAAASNFAQSQKMAGGNLSLALEGAVSSQQLGAYDKLASIDADVRRQNQQSYYQLSGQMQQQRDKISQQNIAYRMYQEQMYGQALQSGMSNITKGLQGVAQTGAGLAMV